MSSSDSGKRRLPLPVLWLVLISLDTAAQLLFKFAAVHVPDAGIAEARLLAAVLVPQLWMALVCFVGAFVAWILILQSERLSSSFPVTALTYVGVLGGSRAVFDEHIEVLQWMGIFAILCGVWMLGADERSRQNGQSWRA